MNGKLLAKAGTKKKRNRKDMLGNSHERVIYRMYNSKRRRIIKITFTKSHLTGLCDRLNDRPTIIFTFEMSFTSQGSAFRCIQRFSRSAPDVTLQETRTRNERPIKTVSRKEALEHDKTLEQNGKVPLGESIPVGQTEPPPGSNPESGSDLHLTDPQHAWIRLDAASFS